MGTRLSVNQFDLFTNYLFNYVTYLLIRTIFYTTFRLANLQELDSRVYFLSQLSLTYSVMDIRYDSMKSLARTAILGTLSLNGLSRIQVLLT